MRCYRKTCSQSCFQRYLILAPAVLATPLPGAGGSVFPYLPPPCVQSGCARRSRLPTTCSRAPGFPQLGRFCSASGVFWPAVWTSERGCALFRGCSVATSAPYSRPRSARFWAGLQAPWLPAGGSGRPRRRWSRRPTSGRSGLAARKEWRRRPWLSSIARADASTGATPRP